MFVVSRKGSFSLLSQDAAQIVVRRPRTAVLGRIADPGLRQWVHSNDYTLKTDI